MMKMAITLLVSGFIALSFAEECKKTKACPSEDKKKCAESKKVEKEKCCKDGKKDGEKCCKTEKSEVKKNQTKCPVMGSAVEIGKSSYVDVKGKRIYICCKGCEAPIKKDPDKFIKQLEDEGIEIEVVPN